MKVKQLLTATVTALALSPFAAYAEGGASAESQAWLASLKSTLSVAEVRAGLEQFAPYGEQHPVELAQPAASTLTREQVKQELATYGVIRVGA
jgi:hypothetical protein